MVVDEDEVSPPRELPAHGPSNLPSLAQRVYTLTASYTRSCFEHRAPDIVVPTLTTVPFRPRFPDHLPQLNAHALAFFFLEMSPSRPDS